MAFRLESAVETLQQALSALSAAPGALDGETRRALADLIRYYGPQIAEQSGPNVAPRARAFLEELWLLREHLPAAAVEAMQKGQGASQGILVSTDEQARQVLLGNMVRVVDVRHYADASGLAEEVIRLVSRYEARLSPAERARWLQLRADLGSGLEIESFLRRVEALLRHYPRVHDLLEARKTWRVLRGPVTVDSVTHADGREAVRFGNVHFPAQVLLSQRSVPLIVHIAQAAAATSAVPADHSKLALQMGALTLVLHAEGFRIDGSLGGAAVPQIPGARTVDVVPDRDCEPVVFFLTAESAGTKHISVDIYQADRNVGALAFDTTVVGQPASVPVGNVALEALPLAASTPGALPPDLELRVTLSGDRQSLSFTLHSPSGSDYHFKPAGKQVLGTDPRDFFQRDLDRLSALARVSASARSPEETRRALQEITIVGIKLYEVLFPPELKTEYRRIRTCYAGKSLLITSDEPWIPWEIVKPFEADADGNVLYDDPPLCEMFRLARWLAGRGPRDRIRLVNGALVLPPGDLQAAQEEAEFFATLHRQQWDINIAQPPLTTLAGVEDSFRRGDTQLFHFACHGNFDTLDPDESKLKLADGFLRPSQIAGDAQSGLRRARPLVFLNACYAGQVGFALTRLGGWAQRFVEAGASAFVGSLWEINDQLAARFAIELYDRLWGLQGHPPATLGEAFYQARLAIKQLDPANPTWLAYVLYGDPEGRIVLGADR